MTGPDKQERASRFHALHERAGAFVIPNPWDAGSARVLAGLGFEALATTSSGFAFTLGRSDGAVTGDEVLRAAVPERTRTWSAALSPDGEYVATAHSEGIQLWNVRTGRSIWLEQGAVEDCARMSFSLVDRKTRLVTAGGGFAMFSRHRPR